jgi:hypothetical protein
MVTDTNPLEKCCSKCDQTKTSDKFIPKRNICKECRNTKCREKYKIVEIDNDSYQTCNSCNEDKLLSSYIRNRNICKDCNNNNRKNKYKTDETHRVKLIKQVTEYKHNKVIERNLLKLEKIGEDNKECSVCSTIKNQCKFRYNRLKCKDCERDEPIEKFKRTVRSRIWGALSNKVNHTIDYLGLSSTEYLQWILSYNEKYTLDNRGKEWHIDHVIPLSKFNLEDKEEQLIAFNWRNTMPLSAKENLSKNNKILIPQIEQHYKYLLEYHKEKNIEMPQEFINLFARHLVAGSS